MHANLAAPGRLLALLLTLFCLSACRPPSVSLAPTESALSALSTVPSATAAPTAAPMTATPPSLPTAVPTLTPAPPTAAPAQAPGATPTTTTTPAAPTSDPVAGLPCPAANPVKPDYARYVLSVEPWPTPDPTAPHPSLSLADPLPAAARNTGYAYGSDGSGRYLLHNGLDMADEDDTPAGAVADGVVVVARDDLDEMFGWRCDWYGQLVVLQLDELWGGQPVYALYGHVSEVQVSEGQRVAQGDPIAREGTAGVAVVPHLHLEIRLGENTFGATRNPLLWLQPWPGSGVVAGRLVDPDGRAWQGVTVTLIDRSGRAPFVNTWTYLDDPDHLIRPDAALAENFVFEPVSEGTYDVYAQVQGVEYRQTVEVVSGELTMVEIVTEPYRTPTPEPTPTP